MHSYFLKLSCRPQKRARKSKIFLHKNVAAWSWSVATVWQPNTFLARSGMKKALEHPGPLRLFPFCCSLTLFQKALSSKSLPLAVGFWAPLRHHTSRVSQKSFVQIVLNFRSKIIIFGACDFWIFSKQILKSSRKSQKFLKIPEWDLAHPKHHRQRYFYLLDILNRKMHFIGKLSP